MLEAWPYSGGGEMVGSSRGSQEPRTPLKAPTCVVGTQTTRMLSMAFPGALTEAARKAEQLVLGLVVRSRLEAIAEQRQPLSCFLYASPLVAAG